MGFGVSYVVCLIFAVDGVGFVLVAAGWEVGVLSATVDEASHYSDVYYI